MTVVGFFLGIVAFVANPFRVLMSGPQIATIADGNGLNPLLQHPLMAIHPPMLYLGYVGFMVPFAFAIASVITKQPGDDWIRTTRIWSMITWMFQGIGILLDALCAVLGWGGYWMRTGRERLLLRGSFTAFLHSVMAREERHDEDLEHRAGFGDVLPVHLRNDVDAQRFGQFRPRFRAVEYRQLLCLVPDAGHRRDNLPDLEPLGLSQERVGVGRGVVARVQFLVQQRDSVGELLRDLVGHAVPRAQRGGERLEDLGWPGVLQ
jgi:hypothetical protein